MKRNCIRLITKQFGTKDPNVLKGYETVINTVINARNWTMTIEVGGFCKFVNL